MNREKAGISKAKLIISIIGFVFCAVTIVFSIIKKGAVEISFAALTILFISIPLLTERFLKFRLNTFFFCFFVLYMISPLLGSIYDFYYRFTWWDDLLHFCGGIVFTAIGCLIAQYLNRNHSTSLALKLVFALCFSLAASVIWEFFEFGADVFFNADMQTDTVITSINSYLLSNNPGTPGRISDIHKVLLDGRSLSTDGYIDIGLSDTMHDMILGALGSLAFVIFVFADKDKHKVFKKVNTTK